MRPPARPRVAVLALAAVAFTIGIAEFTVTGLLPDIAADFGVDTATMSGAISGYALGAVIGAPTIVLAGARFPRRRVLIFLATFVVIGNAAAMVAPTAGLFTVARVVAGLPHGAFFAVAASTIVALIAPSHRGRAIASVFIGQTVAVIVGVPAAAWLGQTTGWRFAFTVVVVTGCVALAGVAVLVPAMPSDPATGLRQQLDAVRSPALWGSLATAVVGVAGIFAVLSFLAPIATAAGLAGTAMPAVMVCFGIGTTAGAVVGGRRADQDARAATHAGLAFAAVSVVVVAVTMRAPWSPFVAALLIGISLQLLVPALQLRAVDAVPTAPALGAALNQSALNGSNALGTGVVAGALGLGMPLTGAPAVALGLVATGGAVALAAHRWAGRPTRVETPEPVMVMSAPGTAPR